jgi:hypothetical protein
MDEQATPDTQARVQTLETLLTQSRAREEALTTRALKDKSTIADLEARRAAAETAAADAERRLSIIRVEVDAKRVEVERLGAANDALQRDLGTLAEQATAAVARGRAERSIRGREEQPDDPASARVLDISEEPHPSGTPWRTT